MLLDNLPGYPDNLMPAASGGKIWVELVKPRNPAIDRLYIQRLHAKSLGWLPKQ